MYHESVYNMASSDIQVLTCISDECGFSLDLVSKEIICSRINCNLLVVQRSDYAF